MPNTNPRCSVLVYYFNEDRYIKAMIQSVLDQTYQNFELILMDNASTDNSRAIAHSFTDPRIRFLDFDESVSGPDYDFARENNVGFNACKGSLIAVIGGDDLLFPDKLAMQVAAFKADPHLDVCHHAAKHIDADSNLLPSCFNSHPYNQANILRIAYTYLEIAYPTTMIKRSSWAKLGGFKGWYAPDLWLWLETAKKWRFQYLPDDLLYYRIHDRSASHSPEGGQRCSDATVKIRADARARYTIEDFFPEILSCPDQAKAKAAAHLELGNMMLGGGMANLQLAFNEYKLADTFWPDHPAIVHNAAVVMALDNQRDEAMKALDSLPDSAMVGTSKALAKGLLRGNFVLSDARGICPELYSVPLPAGAWRSDGTVA